MALHHLQGNAKAGDQGSVKVLIRSNQTNLVLPLPLKVTDIVQVREQSRISPKYCLCAEILKRIKVRNISTLLALYGHNSFFVVFSGHNLL